MVKNLETIQKGKVKNIKNALLEKTNKKFADFLKSVKREINLKKRNILKDSKLQKVEIPKEMIMEFFDKLEEKKTDDINVPMKNEGFQYKKESEGKSQKNINEKAESIPKRSFSEKAKEDIPLRNMNSIKNTNSIKKKIQVMENVNHSKENKADITEIENKKNREHLMRVEQHERIRSDELQEFVYSLKSRQSENDLKKETVLNKEVLSEGKHKVKKYPKEKLVQNEKVMDQEKEIDIEKHKIKVPFIKKQRKFHGKNLNLESKAESLEYKEDLDPKNRITLGSEIENKTREVQESNVEENENVSLKDTVKLKEIENIFHKKLPNGDKPIIIKKSNESFGKLREAEFVENKEKIASPSYENTKMFVKKELESSGKKHKNGTKNSAKRVYVIEDKKNPKDLKTGKHALLKTDSEKKFIEHHFVSEKLVEKSQKIISYGEKVEEKVIEEVVKENTKVKEDKIEKIVVDRKPNYEVRKSIQDMKNQPFKEKILPHTKEIMKIQMENEGFFKSLKVKAIKMEISDLKDHRMEVEKNISLKQSVDEIRKDKKVEKTKFIIDKQIARKKYMVEKEISFVDLKIQNNSKSRKSFEIKMNTNEDKKITLESIVEKIRDMTQRRIEKAFVQLEPPKLGRVEIEIIKEGDSLRIMLRVSTDEAKEILEKGSRYLVTRLENMGFKIENIQVKENFEESYNEDKEHQNGESDFREDREDENKRRKFKEVFKRKVSEE